MQPEAGAGTGRRIIVMRNIIAHEYGEIDYEIEWRVGAGTPLRRFPQISPYASERGPSWTLCAILVSHREDVVCYGDIDQAHARRRGSTH